MSEKNGLNQQFTSDERAGFQSGRAHLAEIRKKRTSAVQNHTRPKSQTYAHLFSDDRIHASVTKYQERTESFVVGECDTENGALFYFLDKIKSSDSNI